MRNRKFLQIVENLLNIPYIIDTVRLKYFTRIKASG